MQPEIVSEIPAIRQKYKNIKIVNYETSVQKIEKAQTFDQQQGFERGILLINLFLNLFNRFHKANSRSIRQRTNSRSIRQRALAC